jgi:hypothetical protein
MLKHSRVKGNTAMLAGGGIYSTNFGPNVPKLTLDHSAATDKRQTALSGPNTGGGGIFNSGGS